MKRGEIRLYNETLAVLKNYCITRGVPLPVGSVKDEKGFSVYNAKGELLPAEGKILQKRSDGSVEWMLMDVLANLGGQERTSIFVEPKRAEQVKVANEVTLNDDGKTVALSNGISEIKVSREGGWLIRKMLINGKTIVDETTRVDLEVVDGGGKIFRACLTGEYKITVPHKNRLRTEIKIEGKHACRDKTTFLDFALRITLIAGSPDIKFEHTFYCREPQERKYEIKAIRLVMETKMNPGATKLIKQLHHGHSWLPRVLELGENVEIVSSSASDIDNYRSSYKGAAVAHPCAGGSVFIRNMDSIKEDWSEYPFHMRPGQESGFRAEQRTGGLGVVCPIIGWKQDDFTLVTTFEHFRQLHPKSINIDENVIVFSILPEWALPAQVVQGVSKSHIFWVTGEPKQLSFDDIEDVLYRWEYGYVEPVDISFDPAWSAYCEVLDCHQLLKFQPEKYPLLENLIEVAPAAGNPNRHTYDRQPATGMFHFGDGHVSPDASSCSNNEDDGQVFFPLQHFLRTGYAYAWDYGKESAKHYMEVDFCEWSTDLRQKGGLIPHTDNHYIGNVYSSHQWAEGILAYYYMTGDERARNVVISVAENHVYWANNIIELVATDGREAGMPLVNLAAAYRLTRDEKYFKTAKHIIENFFVRWINKYGEFKYPKQGTADHPHVLMTGYGDWSSFAGLYRWWELTGDEEIRALAVKLMKQAIKPSMFNVNDARSMDFLAVYAYGRMTDDMDGVIEICKPAIKMLLRRGGHPLRRLHFLNELDKRGLIDDDLAGNRAGTI